MKMYKMSRTNIKKRCPFHYSRLECKRRNQEKPSLTGKFWPWNTKWSTAKANTLVTANILFLQETSLHMNIIKWSIPKSDYLYSLQPKRWSSIQSGKTRPGADCGLDHELLSAKFRLKLKKEGKTTRPLRHDLNQIHYDYTVEVIKQIQGIRSVR